MRLDKWVALTGRTRSQAREEIQRGHVTVNGVCEKDAGRSVTDEDVIVIDGRRESVQRELYLMVNKPQGVLTATEDLRAPTIVDLLPPELRMRRIGPVGRLDKDVTGLVFLTTDGQLAHRLISPKWEIDKVYLATVEGRVTAQEVARFRSGVALKDFTCKPAELEILEASATSRCRVTVREGKYHQVKRMFGATGHEVLALHRQNVAGIELDPTLDSGAWRHLTEAETAQLYALTQDGSSDRRK